MSESVDRPSDFASAASRAVADVAKHPVTGPELSPAEARAVFAGSEQFVQEAEDISPIKKAADTVPKGAALQVAEHTLANLRSVRSERQRRLADLFADLAASGRWSGGSRETDQIVDEIATLEEKIIGERKLVSGLRAERAARVTRAISAHREDAAHRLLAAIASFDRASADLLECVAVIRSAGGMNESFFRVPTLAHLARIAEVVLKQTAQGGES